MITFLLGRVKRESSDFAHLAPCIPKTSPDINVKIVVEILMKIKAELGYRDDPAVFSIDLKVLGSKDINSLMLEILKKLLVAELDFFPVYLKYVKDLPRFYQCFRIFR